MKQAWCVALVLMGLSVSGCGYIPTRTEWVQGRAPWKSNTELCEDHAHGGVVADVANTELVRRGICCDDIIRKPFKGPGPALN